MRSNYIVSIQTLQVVALCILTLYTVMSVDPAVPGTEDQQQQKTQALTIVESDGEDQNQNAHNGSSIAAHNESSVFDSIAVIEVEDEIKIENAEPFLPTNEWQKIKPGQAIPRGLHVRLNLQTGEKEARLNQDKDSVKQEAPPLVNAEKEKHIHDQYTLDELKKAVKDMKSEKFESVDMDTLKKKHKFRSYEELKKDFESIYANIKTDAELITELVELFTSLSPSRDDVVPILEQLEYYLHQIDNALLFCDLGAMPHLLKCLNSSMEEVRSEAALTLGSALQSNPKVQVAAIENGAMHEVLRILAVDPSTKVRKRALYALSTMIRHFPYAQKRFLELGGLSVLTKLFEDKVPDSLKLRAITLLADLIKEKNKHTEHLDLNDSAQINRKQQYEEVPLQEAMVGLGWCQLVSSLLHVPEHGGREQVVVAMDTLLPACRSAFLSAVPKLQSLRQEYVDLLGEQMKEQSDEEDDGFYQGMLNTLDSVLQPLAALTDRQEL